MWYGQQIQRRFKSNQSLCESLPPPILSLWRVTLFCFGMLYCIRWRNLEEGLCLFRLNQTSTHHSRRQKPHGPILTIFGTAHLVIIQNPVPQLQKLPLFSVELRLLETDRHTHTRTSYYIKHTRYNLNEVVIKTKKQINTNFGCLRKMWSK